MKKKLCDFIGTILLYLCYGKEKTAEIMEEQRRTSEYFRELRQEAREAVENGYRPWSQYKEQQEALKLLLKEEEEA